MSGQHKDAVDVYLDGETVARIDAQLDYGDTRSGWIRNACRMRLDGETPSEDDDTE